MTCSSCGNSLESFNKFCPKCGAPAPLQPPSYTSPPLYSSPQSPMGGPMGQPEKKSGCGKIILILAIILLILGGAVAAAIYFGYKSLEKTLKSSEAYTVAVNRLKENEEVREELGEIKETGFPLGSFNQNTNGSGNAAFAMSVKGAKANGHYEVHMTRSRSVWRLDSGVVRLDSGKTIDISEKPEPPEDEANTNFNTNFNANTGVPTPRNAIPKVISGGVMNGKATSLPKPPYPAVARAAHAGGTVVVQVMVDEQGNVISATAISGHPLLRPAAAAAARGAKFTPTKLAGQPVKVSGVITYNFVAE